MTSLSKITSFVFHPIFMPIIGLFLLFQTNLYIVFLIPDEGKELLYSFIGVNTIFAPLLMLGVLYKKGFISDFYLNDRSERWFPLVTIGTFYFFSFYLLNSFNIPEAISAIFLGSFVSTLAAILMNFKWKVSLHMIGIGGLIGLLYAISQLYLTNLLAPILVTILVAGLIATARLKISSHTSFEIYIGVFIGFSAEYLATWFLVG